MKYDSKEGRAHYTALVIGAGELVRKGARETIHRIAAAVRPQFVGPLENEDGNVLQWTRTHVDFGAMRIHLLGIDGLVIAPATATYDGLPEITDGIVWLGAEDETFKMRYFAARTNIVHHVALDWDSTPGAQRGFMGVLNGMKAHTQELIAASRAS